MANDINISDLSFDGIRNSLVEYLQTQETLKDYNFEGSAIRTLVDLLAYNTFYYGYYANMIANEMFLDTAKLPSSIISLTKPLGYVVPGSKSASISLRFFDLKLPNPPEIAPFSTFKGRDVSGKEYFFYNIDVIPILNGNVTLPGSTTTRELYYTDPFVLYEAKSRVYRQLVNVNLETQTIIINDTNIDPRTFSIEVRKKNTNQPLKRWKSYYLEPETLITANTEIFFIERTKTGYKINFGKYTSADFAPVSTGKRIESTDDVYLTYLVSSGSAGNNVSNFRFVSESQNKAITKPTTILSRLSSSVSRGGASEPDLDEVKFFAPKTFARQNRLVTKNDYSSLMAELGYGVTQENQFKIISGEELTPPSFGRVFVSVVGLTGSQSGEINQILSTLKSKSVVGILPEYLSPVLVKMRIDARFSIPNSNSTRRNQARAAVKTALYEKYKYPEFDRKVDKTEVANIIRSSFSGINLNPDNLKLLFNISLPEMAENLGSVGRRINIKNKIKTPYIPVGSSSSRETVRFVPTIPTTELTEIKNSTTTGKYLYYYNFENQRGQLAGEVDYENGVVILYPQITSSGFTVYFELQDDTFTGIDQLACYLASSNVSDLILFVT